MNIFKRTLLIVTFFLATILSADQFQYNDKPTANKAAKLIKYQQEIGTFCAPCGDKSVTTIPVSKVVLKKADDLFIVKVNDQEIDLAYTYIKDRAAWKNLASVLGLNPSDVPLIIKFAPVRPQPTVDSDEIPVE